MTETQISTESFFVPLNKLDRDPKNVRKTYSKEGIHEMAATIRADGYRILQNLVVRKGDKRIILVDGEHLPVSLDPVEDYAPVRVGARI